MRESGPPPLGKNLTYVHTTVNFPHPYPLIKLNGKPCDASIIKQLDGNISIDESENIYVASSQENIYEELNFNKNVKVLGKEEHIYEEIRRPSFHSTVNSDINGLLKPLFYYPSFFTMFIIMVFLFLSFMLSF